MFLVCDDGKRLPIIYSSFLTQLQVPWAVGAVHLSIDASVIDQAFGTMFTQRICHCDPISFFAQASLP